MRLFAWSAAIIVGLVAFANLVRAEDQVTHLSLTDNDINAITGALGKRPAEEVFQTLLKVVNQYQAQHPAIQPQKTEPPKTDPVVPVEPKP